MKARQEMACQHPSSAVDVPRDSAEIMKKVQIVGVGEPLEIERAAIGMRRTNIHRCGYTAIGINDKTMSFRTIKDRVEMDFIFIVNFEADH